MIDATVAGYQQAFLTAAGLMFIGWLVAVFILKNPQTNTHHY
jgi:hypothetical protein